MAFGNIVPATLASFYWGLPVIVGRSGLVATALAIIVYVGSYIYLLRVNPDALRSERYSLEKLAIEKGVYGDSLTGVVENQSSTQQKLSADDNSDESGGNE